MIKNFVFVLGCILIIPFFCFSQGKLMLVGGGSESNGGWSDTPYAWMVQNAQNKKIGIISYSEADEWLPNYLKTLGALEADNIQISSKTEAESASIFEQLNAYDALFFKGGDQKRYYEFYKGTPVQQAIESIYNRGGVIGGTSAGLAILSGVIFTAEEGSAFPYDVLEDVNSEYITLKDDFLQFYPNYLFDSHFVERGRTSRLIGFMAHWYHNQNQIIKGIGIDDRTALCIDETGLGTVYGTGAASVYLPHKFEIAQGQLVDSNIKAIQLTHDQSFDLKKVEVSDRTLSETSQPATVNAFYNVYGSGLSSFNGNQSLLEEVVQSDLLPGKVILMAAAENLLTEAYANFFQENLGEEVVIITTDAENNNENQAKLRNSIRLSGLVVVLEGADLMNFVSSGPTGALLASHLKRNSVTSVFFGSDVAPLIGHSYCSNIYSDPFNAYYNELEFEDGLGLLPQFTIAAKAYELDAKDYYENVTSAVVDQLLRKQLLYGIYLTGNSYFSYKVNISSEAKLSTGGDIPSVVVRNPVTRYEQTSQEVREGISRLQYAFDSLSYQIVKGVVSSLGEVEAKDQQDYELEEEEVLSNRKVFLSENFLLENPVGNYLKLSESAAELDEIQIFDMSGKLVLTKHISSNSKHIKIGFLKNGQYNVIAKDAINKIYYFNKIIKSN